MMRTAMLTMLGAAVVCVHAEPARAHDPEGFARECVEKVDQAVDRCRRATAEDVQACVRRIRRLLNDGQDDAARRVAHRCAQAISARIDRCQAYVREVCERCINVLLDWGFERLAYRVRNVCADALEDLDNLETRALRAIRQALNGG